MPRDRLLLAVALILVATSLLSSLVAFHLYNVASENLPHPHGSLSQDGAWNPFSDSQFWNPWSSLSRAVTGNNTLTV